jgi:hypothetical protein
MKGLKGDSQTSVESGQEHEVLHDRKWGAFCVQGEVAMGGQEPTQSRQKSVGCVSLTVDPDGEFSGIGGWEKEKSPILRTG